jgi:hypothetical protein
MTGRCPCPICNAPEPEPHCFDCQHVFREDEEQFEDTMGNPQCWKCREILLAKAEALYDQMREGEALKREVAGRIQDRRETDRINRRY